MAPKRRSAARLSAMFRRPRASNIAVAASVGDVCKKLVDVGADPAPAETAERYGISDLDGYEPKSLRGIYGGPHPAFDIQ